LCPYLISFSPSPLSLSHFLVVPARHHLPPASSHLLSMATTAGLAQGGRAPGRGSRGQPARCGDTTGARGRPVWLQDSAAAAAARAVASSSSISVGLMAAGVNLVAARGAAGRAWPAAGRARARGHGTARVDETTRMLPCSVHCPCFKRPRAASARGRRPGGSRSSRPARSLRPRSARSP
jgi:hypothetical protein